jgi:hypothetical protein
MSKCETRKLIWMASHILVFFSYSCYAGIFDTKAKITENGITRFYNVSINMFSVIPENALETYEWQGSAQGEAGEMMGLSCYDKIRNFMMEVRPKISKKGLTVNIGLKPYKSDLQTKANSFDVDLTDLSPKKIELARNEDGRVYFVTITPGIAIMDNRPKRADESSFEFGKWKLFGSMVIFNDSLYAGKIGCGGGELAYVSYPGVAKVEFALTPFKDAKMTGTLKDGRIQIHSDDGQTLDIYNVKNGNDTIVLPGGPYEIWVRWQNLPKEKEVQALSFEEWKQMVKSKFAESNSIPPSDKELAQGYEKIKYEKHIALSSGIGPIKPGDRISK